MLAILVALGLVVVPPPAPRAPAPPLAITHVHVVPMDREVVLADHTVVIAGGRIQEVGPAADVSIPEGAQVIDGAGKWLMPGLADMHVHTWMEGDLLLFVANGVTTVRNMFGAPMHLDWRKEIAAGERLGPRIYTAGPILDGNPPVWPGSTVVADAEDAESAVTDQKEASYDFLKVYSMLSAEAFDALCAAGKAQGMRIMGHVPASVSFDHAIDAGQESIEHFTGLVAQCQADDSPLLGKVTFQNESEGWKHLDEAKVTSLAERCRKAGAWNCPTLVVLEKWAKGPDAEALLARPEMRYVDPWLKWAWQSPMMYLANMPDAMLAASHAADPDRARAVTLFHEAGAPLLVGTDMGNPFVVAGWSVHEELTNFVAAGLTPFEALVCATAEAARFMHAESEWGTIRPAASADLVLLEANPLDDVANAARRAGVVLQGTWYSEADLHERLETVAREYEERLAQQGGEPMESSEEDEE